MKYTLSKQAESDVKNLIRRSYLSFGFEITDKYQKGLNNCFGLLASEPSIGTSADGLRAQYHKFPYKSMLCITKYARKMFLLFVYCMSAWISLSIFELFLLFKKFFPERVMINNFPLLLCK